MVARYRVIAAVIWLCIVCVGLNGVLHGPSTCTAFQVERPTLLQGVFTSDGVAGFRRVLPSTPSWMGRRALGKLIVLPSKRFCELAVNVSMGKFPIQHKSKKPLRLDGVVVVSLHEMKEGCTGYLKARAAEWLGAEGYLVAEPTALLTEEAKNSFVQSFYGAGGLRTDPPLDIPVELISREEYDLLVAAVQQVGLDVTVSMGIDLDSTRFF